MAGPTRNLPGAPPMITRPLTLLERQALLAEKTKAAAEFIRKQPTSVIKLGSLIVPHTPRRRSGIIRTHIQHVASLQQQLQNQALDAEKARQVRDTLQIASRKLKEVVKKSARHRALKKSRTVGTIPLSAIQTAQKKAIIEAQLARLQSELGPVRAKLIAATTPELRKHASTKLKVIGNTVAGLKYRHSLLAKNRGVIPSRVLSRHQLSFQLPEMGVPEKFIAPNRERTAVVIRLIALNRPRKEGESEDVYRAVLKAYVKRALLRYINKPSGNPTIFTGFAKPRLRQPSLKAATMAINQAIDETLREDQAALEEAAKQGGVPEDPISNVVDVSVQDAAEEIEEAVIDFAPETTDAVTRGMITTDLDGATTQILTQAREEDAALQAEGTSPTDLVVEPSGAIALAEKPEPFYMKKEFLLLAGAGALAVFLLMRR